jgi:hypothetical protein
MCETQSERRVMVCDVAIVHVRQQLETALGGGVRYTAIDGEGTLVEADATLDPERFQGVVQAAIAAAQDPPGID